MTKLIEPSIFAIERGKPLMETLLKYAQERKLPSASISGLGALQDPTLGYFDFNIGNYHFNTIKGLYELISLNGNITKYQGEYVVHVHVALGNDQYQVFGGHLKEAIVGVTAEITITPLTSSVNRKPDLDTHLNLIHS